MTGPLVIVGDALLDRDVNGRVERLCPDTPAPVLEDAREVLRPGGAALAALLAAASGAAPILVAPLGDDPASATVYALLPAQVTVTPLPLHAGPVSNAEPAGLAEKTRYRAGGRTLLRVDRPAGLPGGATAEALAAIDAADTLLVCDYGNGASAIPAVRDALARRSRHAPLTWDPHPEGAVPAPGTRVATPNAVEAAQIAGVDRSGNPLLAAAAAADRLLEAWPTASVAVTLGDRGALLARREQAPLAIPAASLSVSDTCGAGDQFAVATAMALAGGATVSEAVTAAVESVADFLAAGGVDGLRPRTERRVPPDKALPATDGLAGHANGLAGHAVGLARGAGRPLARAGTAAGEPDIGRRLIGDAAGLARLVRAQGRTLVATGGCFDVLHAGHVAMLRAARSLGDSLVVCLNSDESVRRLKGPGRPLNPAADRIAVLSALDCVDAVAVFDEDTPQRLLGELRPHIWVKGGDYEGQHLPEAATLRQWNGRVVTVPYLSGRSTSRLASAAARTHREAPAGPAPAGQAAGGAAARA